MLLLSTIIEWTRKYINEYVTGSDDFREETDALLEAHVDAAARMTVQMVPNHYVTLTEKTYGATEFLGYLRPDGRQYMVLHLPDDFLKLECLSVTSDNSDDGLKTTVRTFLPQSHPSYAQQYSSIPGIGAGQYMPVVYRMGTKLEIHSFPEESRLELAPKLSYVAVPQLTGNNDARQYATLSESLRDAVALRAASLYLSLTGDSNAQAANDAADKALEAVHSS